MDKHRKCTIVTKLITFFTIIRVLDFPIVCIMLIYHSGLFWYKIMFHKHCVRLKLGVNLVHRWSHDNNNKNAKKLFHKSFHWYKDFPLN